MDQQAHDLEPEVKLALLEEPLNGPIAASLKQLEEDGAYLSEIFNLVTCHRVERLERIAILDQNVEAAIDLIIGHSLLQEEHFGNRLDQPRQCNLHVVDVADSLGSSRLLRH